MSSREYVQDIYRYVEIYGGDRDRAANSNGNNIEVSNLSLMDVVAVEIADLSFPKSDYNVTSDMTSLRFSETDAGTATAYTATITAGNYTIAALQTHLKTQMDAVGGFQYTWTTEANTERQIVTVATDGVAWGAGASVTLTVNRTASLDYPRKHSVNTYDNDLWKMLGFAANGTDPSVAQAAGSTITSPNRYDLDPDPVVYLELPNLPVPAVQSMASQVDSPTFVISLAGTTNGTWVEKPGRDVDQKILFTHPIRIQRLQVRWRHSNGTLYDLQGRDPHLILKFTCRIPYVDQIAQASAATASLSSKRGRFFG